MDIDLLVVADCPNEAPAADLLRSALDQAGLPTQHFRVTVVADEQAAAPRGFAGSPTFLINGSDPFGDSKRPTGLTCRLYRQSAGRASGLPTLDDLRDALTAAAQGRSTAGKN